jgi:hypothetical protein
MAGDVYLGWYSCGDGVWRPLSGEPVRLVRRWTAHFVVVRDNGDEEVVRAATRALCIRK